MDTGGDSLLKLPQMDVAIKVFRGGGLEESVINDTFYGVTGKPVPRHQFSLLERPSESAKLRVYKGGGMNMIEGKSLAEVQSKPEYASLVATGREVLSKTETEGDSVESLTAALNKCGVYFYGNNGPFTLDYTSQVLLFSTALTPVPVAPAPAPGPGPVAAGPGRVAAGPGPVAAGAAEGDAAAPPAPAPAAPAPAPDAAAPAPAPDAAAPVAAPDAAAPDAAAPDAAPALPSPEDAAEGTLGILVVTVTGGKWTLSVPEASTDTIDMPPYIIRDPSTLTADEFFSTLTKSEVLYMSDVIFKGYPLRNLIDVLTDERKKDFFEKVWKPLVEQRITGSLTLKYDPELQEAKAYIGELRRAQINVLEEHVEKFLVGQGKEVAEEAAEEEAEEEAAEEEAEEEKAEEAEKGAEEEEKGAEEAEVKGAEEEKGTIAVKEKAMPRVTGFKPKITPKKAVQAEQKKQPCSTLAKDTTPDEFIQYLRAIYTLIQESTDGLPDDINSYVATLEGIAVPKSVPGMEIHSKVQPLVTELKRVRGIMMQNKSQRLRSKGTMQNTLATLTKSLSDSICRYYIQIKELNPGPRPKGGKRVTRKKQKRST